MKKIITGFFVIVAATTGYAQSPNETEPVLAVADHATTHAGTPARSIRPYAIHVKAVRNFYSKYGESNSESWYATDGGFRAKFRQNNIACMADYDKSGNWLCTIKTYTENELPKHIRQQVRREYFDHAIFLVQEINQRKQTVYLVSIENKKEWMTLRLAGDEMEIAAAYVK